MKTSTSNFPTVGDSVLAYVGTGAACRTSKYTIAVPKQTMGRGSSPTGKKANRSSSLIHEANGPKCTIVATLYKANAASANDTERNVRIMPSATGVGDFWKARNITGQRAY